MRLLTQRFVRAAVLAACLVLPPGLMAARPTAAVTAAAAPTGPGRLAIARLQYDGGGDWYANPSSLPNLITAIATRTSLPIERVEAKVKLTDSALFDFPFLHATGHGEIKLSDVEIRRLREYLTRGGFLLLLWLFIWSVLRILRNDIYAPTGAVMVRRGLPLRGTRSPVRQNRTAARYLGQAGA